jgi:hypothetical protein
MKEYACMERGNGKGLSVQGKTNELISTQNIKGRTIIEREEKVETGRRNCSWKKYIQ